MLRVWSGVEHCTGDVLRGEGTSSAEVSSSSEGLYVNLLHTGLRLDTLVLHGVTGTGLKEAFLMLEIW